MSQNIAYTYEIAEFAGVLKAICDQYKIPQENIVVFKTNNSEIPFEFHNKVKLKRSIPIPIPVPEEVSPHSINKNHQISLNLVGGVFDKFYVRGFPSTFQIRGLGEFELQAGRPIRFWRWNGRSQLDYVIHDNGAYFIEKKNLYSFRKTLLRWDKILQKSKNVPPPILLDEMLTEIYKNSIDFLIKGKTNKAKYDQYNIPYKRGILLCGPPGSGKTLTCKWLRSLCDKNSLTHRIITMQQYRGAIQNGEVGRLFRMPSGNPGLIFFDDMDVMVKNRRQTMNGHELSTFLSELDGIEPASGVVYVFTTNYIEELDEAFVRPGRIDLWLHFRTPKKHLRRKFIKEKYEKEILALAPIEEWVQRTEDYNFAEMEEVRKLFCHDIFDEKELSIDRTFELFEKHRKEFAERTLGFNSLQNGEFDEDESYGEEGYGAEYPIPPDFIP
jgi:AAA+ superfamily predicted ATPase